MLYRVFPLRPGAAPLEAGGALYVPRERQGAGRHDNPDRYGALYVSRSPVSAVAERIQVFRGQPLGDQDLRYTDGRADALCAIDDEQLSDIVDLDDPRELSERDIQPSGVATRQRTVTQAIAGTLFDEGWAGFQWWSTLEASWANATLFAERAVPELSIAADPEPLTTRDPAVVEAADALGIRLQPP